MTGSYREDGPRLAELRRLGARVQVGHREEALGDADLVVVSSAVRDDNPELLAARRRGIPVKKRDQWLPELTAGYDLLAVGGTHGKTTTTSLLALVLEDAEQAAMAAGSCWRPTSTTAPSRACGRWSRWSPTSSTSTPTATPTRRPCARPSPRSRPGC